MENNLPKSIVFITGAFVGNNCWDEWIVYFENSGYCCMAPAWPFKDAPPEDLRNRHPDAAIASNRLNDLTDYFATIVNALQEQPIIIGHSLGGLIVQLLLQRGIGAAGVAIHSFPPYGVNTFRYSFIKAWWEAIGLFTSPGKTYMVSFKKWKYTVANGMECQHRKDLYYRYAIPESKLVIRDTFKCMAKINFKKDRAPLLFISGSRDRIIPASLNYMNYKKYRKDNSITDYKESKGQNHLVFGHPAWTEDAEFILYWLQHLK
ncbi:MAG: alpha/beta hydrolase [Rhizobacter sp.]|nr:alpha/beta hydrolase [Ferruginibacter sp.]